MTLEIGRVIAERYEVTEKIGSGGMSIVYKALDRKLSRPVSLKVLREEYSVDEDFRKRFIREARSVASLNHQNIVGVYDVGQEDGINFIVMEYIAGMTLKELINKRAPFSDQEALGVAIQMAAGILHAHNSKIIHRDIKPQNVIVTGKGVIKVADFGIARKADSNSMTIGGTTLGSVHYFSPEQAKGVKADQRSDLYSVGIVMYEMFTGELPFDADTAVSVALMQINEPLPDILVHNPNINPKVKMIIGKLTEKENTYRYQSAEDLLQDLRAIIANPGARLSFEGESFAPRAAVRSRDPVEDYDYYDTGELPDDDDYEEEEDFGYDAYVKPARPAKPAKPVRRESTRRSDTDHYDDYDDDYDYDTDHPKGRRGSERERYAQPKEDRRDRTVVVAAVAVALVLFVLVGVLVLPPLIGDIITGGDPGPHIVYLPEMLGVDAERLRLDLADMGLYLEVLGDTFHESVPAGAIVESTFDYGDYVERGTTVGVVVSLGQHLVEVPDFYGLLDIAAIELRNELERPIELIQQHEFNDMAAGMVFAQNPPAGTYVMAGSEVTIYISMGQTLRERFPMPSLTGQSLSDALNELERLGLRVGNVTQRYDAQAPVDQVLVQSLTAGAEVFAGIEIDLIVSAGPQVATTPEPDPNDNNNNDNGQTNPLEPGNDGLVNVPPITPLPYTTPDPNAPPQMTPMPSPSPTPPPTPIPTPPPAHTPVSTPPIQYFPPSPTPVYFELPTPSPPLTLPTDPPPVIPPGQHVFSVWVTEDTFRERNVEAAEVRVSIHHNLLTTTVETVNLHLFQLPREFHVPAHSDAIIQVHINNILTKRSVAESFPRVQ